MAEDTQLRVGSVSRGLALLVAGAMFMEIMDGTVIAPAAPWRGIFLLQVPLGVAGFVLALRLVPDVRSAERRALDGRGFLLVAVGTAALVVGLESIGSTRPHPVPAVVGLGVAAVALGAAVRYLLRASRPLVDLWILRIATFRVTALAGSGYRAAITAIPVLLALFFQLGFGWAAAQAGLAVIALFVGNIGIKPATTPLQRRFGIRPVMVASIVAGAACLVGMAFLQASPPLPLLLGLLLVSGVAR